MKKLPLTIFAVLASAILLGSLMTYLPAGPSADVKEEEVTKEEATKEEVAPALEKYINEDKGYSISYPNGWQKQELPRLDIVLFSPARNETSQTHATMNIVSEKVGNSISLDQFYSESVKHLTTELKEAQVEGTGDLKIGDLPSKWILYTHTMVQSKFSVLQYFIVANENIYLLTFSATSDDFDHFRSAFENIAKSFRLLPKSDAKPK